MADNRAFFVSGELQDVSGKTLLDGISDVTVSEHSHDYKSETGKCACGKTCDHANVDSKTGICGDCGYQLTAGISGVETPSYYGNIDDAFAAAVSEENNGCTLTLYKNCELTDDPIIDKTLTLNVNGKTITASDKEIIVRLGTLTLTDGGAWLSIAERANGIYRSSNNDDKPVVVEEAPIKSATLNAEINKLYRNSNADPTLKFNLSLAIGTNLNDSDVSMRYGINSYESGDTVYSGLSTLLQDTLLSASEILEKAGDSDVAEIYYTVTTGDGYEIKSSTLRIDLVDCEHSHVVDPTTDEETGGNIEKPTYCEICKNQFHAKIVNGDSVKYYNDLYEAVADAQKSENEGCTLYPLYDENGYKEQIVISGGKFTFRLLARVYLSKPVIIKGDAYITISGRALVTNVADKTAVIVEGGNVDFTGLATDDVTINGGNVTMTGNNIKRLTINGGDVSIGGGQFAQIDVNAEGKVIADYIVPGNWVQDGNTNE